MSRPMAAEQKIFLTESFDDSKAWHVFASGQAVGKLRATVGPEGRPVLRLDYNFHGGSGFVVMRREMRFIAPETFQMRCLVRGTGPQNQLEIKFADLGNTNVWRFTRANFKITSQWKLLQFTEREMPFAWGPSGGGAPSEIGALEIAVVAGPGGKGTLELSAPELVDETVEKPLTYRASSFQKNYPPEAVFDAHTATGWRAARGDATPFWEADFGRVFRFGGLVIEWPQGSTPKKFAVETSLNGRQWKKAYEAQYTSGSRSHIPITDGKARFLRFRFPRSSPAALGKLTMRAPSFSETPSTFMHHVAADYPRGWFPRYWLREQSYWTTIGSPQGGVRGLINEEGQVETNEAGFSLEPFILHQGRIITWAQGNAVPSLENGGLPVPAVTWKTQGLQLEIKPWMDDENGSPVLRVNCRLRTKAPHRNTRLIVAIRPFQVTPPSQAFRNLGGRSPIQNIACQKNGFVVQDQRVLASPSPTQQGVAAFEEGEIFSFLLRNDFPSRRRIHNESGLAYGVMAWAFPAGSSSLEVTVSYPYDAKARRWGRSRKEAIKQWRETLSHVQWRVPPCAREAFACFHTAAGHILINREGHALQPGPRRYTRSWVRDSVIMGTALAKAGLPNPLRDFLEWYQTFQRKDGFIPCVVDLDGVDWLVEHDSHGQFLWGVREAQRYGASHDWVEMMMPSVAKAANYLFRLRRQRLGSTYRREDKATFHGLLPESASHEGYLAHPVHSYWDDFWGIRGLEAAADLAKMTADNSHAKRWQQEAKKFQSDVFRSMARVVKDHKLDYIPGSVEWADFDPTATSNAIALLDFARTMPKNALHTTLEKFLEGFRRKRDGTMPWNNYTPYEIRIISAFVRLGNREAANELLDFFLADRRPPAWNQWPEIIYHDKRAAGHLGDIPHTWIGAEYILALAAMIADERESDQSLILASGMPWEWVAQERGFAVRGLPTRYGKLNFSIHAPNARTIELKIGGDITQPSGGIFVMPPLPKNKHIVGIIEKNSTAALHSETSLQITTLPSKIRLCLA